MKTRSVHTKIWNDPWFEELAYYEKLLFIYLITNSYINLPGIYEISDRRILLETGITQDQLKKAKEAISNKILFHNGWVIVKNIEKYDSYAGGKLDTAKESQLKDIPFEILDTASKYKNTLSIGYGRGIDTSSTSSDTPNSNSNSRSNSNISRKIVKKPSLEDIDQDYLRKLTEDFSVPMSFVLSKLDDLESYCKRTGTIYKDYPATLRTWVKKDALERRENVQRINEKNFSVVSTE